MRRRQRKQTVLQSEDVSSVSIVWYKQCLNAGTVIKNKKEQMIIFKANFFDKLEHEHIQVNFPRLNAKRHWTTASFSFSSLYKMFSLNGLCRNGNRWAIKLSPRYPDSISYNTTSNSTLVILMVVFQEHFVLKEKKIHQKRKYRFRSDTNVKICVIIYWC